MEKIKFKKKIYPIQGHFEQYIERYNNNVKLPLSYKDLLRFQGGLVVYDAKGNDTLWISTYFQEDEKREIDSALKQIYSILHMDGGNEMEEFLNIDAIDFCTFGNTKPFRIKIRNVLNDNYVYFYVKQADASRAYGLELEHILSPNLVNYVTNTNTLIEEHIQGIPGDVFMAEYLPKCDPREKAAIAKEFVKFNERCFIRLLGDMRSYNYVVVLTHDFDRIQYRFRSVDFDQQSFEGDLEIYTPQSFKENSPLVDLVEEVLSESSVLQYKREERALIAKRFNSEKTRMRMLLSSMRKDILSTKENIVQLRSGLYALTGDVNFKRSKNMGDLLNSALSFVKRNYENVNPFLLHRQVKKPLP